MKQEVKTLETNIEKVESEKEPLKRRELEKVIFRAKDIGSNIEVANAPFVNYVKVFFKEKNDFALFNKHMPVNNYVEPNLHEIGPIILFLKLLDIGVIKQEVAGNKVVIKVKAGEYIYERDSTFW